MLPPERYLRERGQRTRPGRGGDQECASHGRLGDEEDGDRLGGRVQECQQERTPGQNQLRRCASPDRGGQKRSYGDTRRRFLPRLLTCRPMPCPVERDEGASGNRPSERECRASEQHERHAHREARQRFGHRQFAVACEIAFAAQDPTDEEQLCEARHDCQADQRIAGAPAEEGVAQDKRDDPDGQRRAEDQPRQRSRRVGELCTAIAARGHRTRCELFDWGQQNRRDQERDRPRGGHRGERNGSQLPRSRCLPGVDRKPGDDRAGHHRDRAVCGGAPQRQADPAHRVVALPTGGGVCWASVGADGRGGGADVG